MADDDFSRFVGRVILIIKDPGQTMANGARFVR
jgi:hypothetical protein